jgi:hypothetical protein
MSFSIDHFITINKGKDIITFNDNRFGPNDRPKVNTEFMIVKNTDFAKTYFEDMNSYQRFTDNNIIKSDEYRRLMAIINKMSTSEGTEQLQLSRVVDSFMTAIRSSTSSLSQSIDVTEDDVEAMLYMLEKDNKILVVDDTINIV